MEDRKRAAEIDNKLLIAAGENDLENINRLIKEGACINFKDKNLNTPLHWAVKNGHLEVVTLLLNRGASVKIENNEDKTAVDIAKDIGRQDIVEILENSLHTNKDAIKCKGNIVSGDGKIPKKETKLINAIHGNIYQLKMLMLFLYRGVSLKYSFRLGTEIKEAQKFDDIIFEYSQNNRIVYRLLQLKHRIDETRKITARELLLKKGGDYNLIKYFISYNDCKKQKLFKSNLINDVTICTNIGLDLEDLKKENIVVQKIENKDDILNFKLNFKSDKNPALYKFNENIVSLLKPKLENLNKITQSATGEYSDDEIKDFIKHLVFAVNQPNEEELDDILKNEISKEFDYITTENVYNKFFMKMLNWFQRSESEFMSYEDGKKFFDEIKTGIPIWFNVRHPVDSFVGREQQLNYLHELLQRDEKAQTLKIICVTGLGGIGKTEFVRKYIKTYSNIYENKIVWINAESFETLNENFRELARDYLCINTKDANGEEKGMASILKDVYNFFSNRKSLFVFDNTEKYKSQEKFDYGIQKFLPSLPSDLWQPYIVFTSRNQKWPKNVQILQLNVFEEKEAKEFITKSLNLKNDENDVVRLGKETQFLPLALQQAVAYIIMQNKYLNNVGMQFKIDDYLKKYKEKQILNFIFPDDSDNTYTKTVFTTWNITLNSIKQKEAGNNAIEILNILSYACPENIPTEILLYLVNDKEKLGAAIELLKQYSLINTEKTMLNIHRLLQYVIRLQLQEQNKEENILIVALKSFEENKINPKTLDHALSIWRYSYKYDEIVNRFSPLASSINVEFINCGRYEDAYTFGNELSQLLTTISPFHPGLLSANNNIASSLLKLGKYEKALNIFQNTLKIQETFFGAGDELGISYKKNVALTLYNQGKYTEALKWYEDILNQELGMSDENDVTVLLTKRDIAAILIQQGLYNKSEQMLLEVYNMQEKFLGKDHPDTLITQNSIAAVLVKLSKYDEALPILRHICEVEAGRLGSDHPDVLISKKNLAVTLSGLERNDEAMHIFKQILNIENTVLGKDHPNTLFTHNYIANILQNQGKYENALQEYEKILDVQRSVLGSEHPDTLNTLLNKALALERLEKYDDALCLFEDILHRKTPILGCEHPEILQILGFIARINLERRHFDEALRVFNKILQVQISKLGENHVDTLSTKNSIGLALVETNQSDKALDMFYDNLNKLEKIYITNPNHSSILGVKENISLALFHQKKYNESLKMYQQVLKLKEVSLGKENYQVAIIKANVGQLLINKKKISEALNIFQEVINVFEKVLKPDNPKILQIGKVIQTLSSIHSDFLKAALNNHYEKFVHCINEGVDVNTKDSEDRSVLQYVVSNQNLKMVNVLLQNGADVAQVSNKGETLLHNATSVGSEQIVETLLSHVKGTKLKNFVDAKTSATSTTSLHVAAKNGYLNIVILLLKHGATYEINNQNGETPRKLSKNKSISNLLKTIDEVFKGARKGDISILSKLKTLNPKQLNAVANTRNNNGHTLLQTAAMNKHTNIAIKLVELLKTLNENV